MGISDEDYADALSYYKLQQAQAQQQQMENQMSLSGATGLGNLIGAVGLGGLANASQQAQQSFTVANNAAAAQATWLNTAATTQASIGGLPLIKEEDLKHDAMQAPLSALVDMWTMRWGGEWVSQVEFAEDDFWRLALVRLIGAGKLEKHNLTNSYHPVYRIIE